MTWWILIVLATVAVMVAVGVVALRAVRDAGSQPAERRSEQPDDMFMLGVIFLGSGIALFVAVGPAMLGVPVLGAIFMAVGAQRMRQGR